MKSAASIPRISNFWLRQFAAYNRRYLRRHFHSLRILKSGLPRLTNRPTVIFLNHAAWWDPLVCLFLAREFFAERHSFAPIEAAILKRYRFFKHLGFFGIEPQSAGGARTLLRTGVELLVAPQNLLWLTPQGRFADPRERPPQLQSGIGALAVRLPDTVFLPLAIEYPFWTEARPEILVSFGAPITREQLPSASPNELTQLLAARLEETQTQLAAHSLGREPDDWLLLNRGRSGFAGIYGRLLRLRGENFAPEDQPEAAR